MATSGVICSAFQDVVWRQETWCSYQDEIAVFRYPFAANALPAPRAERLLHPDELRRAHRYHREEDRQRFMYTRSILRLIAGNYTNQPPEQIQFTTGQYNKPELSGHTGWHISVSHSGNWILLAVGRVSVGVDVEKINPEFSFTGLLLNSFSEEEQLYIKSGTHARLRFYQLWTRKEALLKATGRGLVDAIGQVPSLEGLHSTDSGLIGSTGNWLVQGFAVADEYPAAVAYREIGEMPKFYTLTRGLFNL